LETVLAYNLFANFIAYDSYEMGMNAVRESFNGLDELLARPDVGATVADFYASIDLEDVLDEDKDPSGSIRYMFLELIASQEDVLANLGTQGRAELLAAMAEKSAAKASLPGEPFSDWGVAGLADQIAEMDRQ
jgi:hypothetical protein